MKSHLLCFLASLVASVVASVSAAAAPVDYARTIRPLLEARCYGCHGPEKHKSGYRLDVREIALRGGDSGKAAIVPHNAKASQLIRYVSGEDKEILMPPKESGKAPLTAKQGPPGWGWKLL
jgi:hypothetical protein